LAAATLGAAILARNVASKRIQGQISGCFLNGVRQRRKNRPRPQRRAAGGLDESLDTGLALEVDVSRALGLTEHIKALAAAKPVKK